MGMDKKLYCDNCGEDIDTDNGVLHGYETDYAQTEIVILTCSCGKKYLFWTDFSSYYDYEEGD